MNPKDRLAEAIKIFGEGVVMTVTELVNVADADGVYTLLEDMGQYEAAECLSYLYFEH